MGLDRPKTRAIADLPVGQNHDRQNLVLPFGDAVASDGDKNQAEARPCSISPVLSA
jgi:hypothetical protein